MSVLKKALSVLTAVLLVASLASVAASALNLDNYTKQTFKAPFYANAEGESGMGETWIYESSVGYETEFTPMDKGTGNLYYSSSHRYPSKVIAEWGSDIYIVPGIDSGKSVNVSQTFVVGKDGYVTVNACDVVRHFRISDTGSNALQDNEIAIYHNDKKIWPEGDSWKKITAAANDNQPIGNVCSVPEISDIKVTAGDKIRFVVGCGTIAYAEWNDYTQWYVTVDLYTENTKADNGDDEKTDDGKKEDSESTDKNDTAVKEDLSKLKKTAYTAPYYANAESSKGLGEIWVYEYSTAYNNDFQPMNKGDGKVYYTSSHKYPATFVAEWSTDIYLRPGIEDGKSINAVQTFVVPDTGYATIDPCQVIRHFKMNDTGDAALQDCEIAIYLNDKKIWPADDSWAKITASATYTQPVGNVYSVPEISQFAVKQGDKIRFAVGCGDLAYAEWNDYVQWYATVNVYSETSNGAAFADTGKPEIVETGEDTRVVLFSLIFTVSLAALLLRKRILD